MAIPSSVAQRMRARREELGLSQAALARRIGVSRAYIGNTESGGADWEPTVENLVAWSVALGWEPDYLVRQAGRLTSPGASELDLGLLGAGALAALRTEVAAAVRDGILAAIEELRAAAPPPAGDHPPAPRRRSDA